MASNPEQAIKDLVQTLKQVTVERHQTELDRTFDEAVDLAEHNEWGIALEVLCDNLFEYDFPLPNNAFRRIQEIGRLWGINAGTVENLLALVETNQSEPISE